MSCGSHTPALVLAARPRAKVAPRGDRIRRRLPQRRSLGYALALSALLAACDGAGEPAAGVTHLDLRLLDGTSCAVALDQALELHEIQPDVLVPASISPWTLEGGRLASRAVGTCLISDAGAVASLRLGEPFPVDGIADIELVLTANKTTRAEVFWSGPAGEGRQTQTINPSKVPRRISFPIWKEPTWSGDLDSLVVTPSTGANVLVAVHSVRLVPVGFRWGDEPLGDEHTPGPGGERGDAGLRIQGHEARRAWPADLDVPLFAEVSEVPRAGTLSVAVARGGVALGLPGAPLSAVVDARTGEASWRRLARLDLEESISFRSSSWHSLQIDLSPYAGQALELRFLAAGSAAPSPADVPPEARRPSEEHLLWGAPVVLGEPPQDRRPNLVLVTLDTTRADALGGEFTPFLNRFAEDAAVFTDAWSTCNSTTPSHASILTGLHVEEHGTLSNRHFLAPEIHTLAESLRAAGYLTAAAVSVPHVQAGNGFGQGFDLFALARPGAELDGALALEQIERWVEQWRTLPRRPLFLWVHLFDPHSPYDPPAAFKAQFLASSGLELPDKTADPPTVPVYRRPDDPLPDPEQITGAQGWRAGVSSLEYFRFVYALGVAYTDHLLERLVAGLDSAGILDDAAVVIAADHGESLGEHDIWFRHAGLFRETLQVPLLLRLPDGPHGVSIDAPVSTLDIAPTFLRLGAVPNVSELSGRDLIATLEGADAGGRTIWFAYAGLHQVGFRTAETHFVKSYTDDLSGGTQLVNVDGEIRPRRLPGIPAGRSFLFDPKADPALTRDLAPERPSAVAEASARLEVWREGLKAARAQRRDLTDAEEAELQGLGYTGD